MTAQTCLHAPFGQHEPARLATGDPIFYQVQRDFLQFCADTHQMPSEYLWDLLPAMYLSAPTLFDHTRASVSSTLADLRDGMIVLGEGADAATLTLPLRILDRPAFYATLDAAWSQVVLDAVPPSLP